MRAAFVLLASTLLAQSPIKIDYTCTPEDIDSFGLSCSPDDPCPVFLELSSAEAVGSRLFVAGNLHTARTTLYGVLLSSEDNGRAWTEPLKRLRAASLEQVQFFDYSNGWISGQIIEPLPKDPFFLITADGGKTWRRKPIFEDSRFGSIAQFWFDSKSNGELVIDHGNQHELYATHTGGESWEIQQTAAAPIRLKPRRDQPTWRLRPDGNIYHLERRGSSAWEPVAAFTIHISDCK